MNALHGTRRFSPLVLFLLVFLIASCSDAAGPDPILLEVVAGDGQEAQVGSPVAAALIVHVMGLDSVPRQGVPVEWTVLQGGGTVDPVAASSDTAGIVEAAWTLGSEPGEQLVRASAGGESVSFDAWAAPPPPEDWSEVIEIRPSARLESDGETLTGSIWLFNHWGGTLRLTTNACFFGWHYPALYTMNRELVKQANNACTFMQSTTSVPPGDSIYRQGDLNVAIVPAGEYILRIGFGVGEINGEEATLPDVETTVTIGG